MHTPPLRRGGKGRRGQNVHITPPGWKHPGQARLSTSAVCISSKAGRARLGSQEVSSTVPELLNFLTEWIDPLAFVGRASSSLPPHPYSWVISSNLDTGFYSLGDSRQISFMWSEVIFSCYFCAVWMENQQSLCSICLKHQTVQWRCLEAGRVVSL